MPNRDWIKHAAALFYRIAMFTLPTMAQRERKRVECDPRRRQRRIASVEAREQCEQVEMVSTGTSIK